MTSLALACATSLLLLPGALRAAPQAAGSATTPRAQAAPSVDLVVQAAELHVGDGQVLADMAVAVEGGLIVEVAPRAKLASVGRSERRVATLLPGLVASFIPEASSDPQSVNAHRLAAASFDASLAAGWTDWGITSLAILPGPERLVPGRAGLVRLLPGAPAIDLAAGAICASLGEEALDPPPIFEPTLRTHADNPLQPARPQRPATSMAAIGELRRLVTQAPEFEDVRARRVPLRVRADQEADVRRVVALARELGVDVVLEGGAEAWKLAAELAAANVRVVLELGDPGTPGGPGRDVDIAPNAAGVLERAGVKLALSWRENPGASGLRADPLFLAAVAVRQGLSPAAAIAAISGRAAAAAGARRADLVRAGAAADLAGFDGPPLSLHSTPAFVMVGGKILPRPALGSRDPSASKEDDQGSTLALRAGRVLTGKGMLRDGIVLLRDRKIVSVGTSPALPEDATIHDFGAAAVLTPGLVDAFGWAGLEPGATPGGSSRLRAADAIEAGHPSLRRALRSGVTAAFVAPGSRGLLLGSACSVATAPSKDGSAEVLAGPPAFVFWLDGGPSDGGPRAPRLKGLKDFLQKAKNHHEQRVKKEKQEKPEPGKKENGEADEPDPALEPLRALFGDKPQARAILRSGRQDVMLEALDTFKASGLTPILAGAEESDLIAGELATRGVGVILSPRTTRSQDGRRVSVAATLRAAGVTLALGSFGYGSSDQLPLAACAAVRDGLSAEDALAALTTAAASLVGPTDAGRLEAGARADVVAWSGDPLEPASRVLAVVSGGRLVEETEP